MTDILRSLVRIRFEGHIFLVFHEKLKAFKIDEYIIELEEQEKKRADPLIKLKERLKVLTSDFKGLSFVELKKRIMKILSLGKLYNVSIGTILKATGLTYENFKTLGLEEYVEELKKNDEEEVVEEVVEGDYDADLENIYTEMEQTSENDEDYFDEEAASQLATSLKEKKNLELQNRDKDYFDSHDQYVHGLEQAKLDKFDNDYSNNGEIAGELSRQRLIKSEDYRTVDMMAGVERSNNAAVIYEEIEVDVVDVGADYDASELMIEEKKGVYDDNYKEEEPLVSIRV